MSDTVQREEDFNFGALRAYQKKQRRVDTLVKGIIAVTIVSNLLIAGVFSWSVYTYKDRLVIIADKTYYRKENPVLLAETFAKNYSLDLLEFDQHNAERKVNNIFRQSVSNSNARSKIKQLLNEKYAEETKTLGVVRTFDILEKEGKQMVHTKKENGVFYTEIKGIQRNINNIGVEIKIIEMTVESVKYVSDKTHPEGFRVRDFKVDAVKHK